MVVFVMYVKDWFELFEVWFGIFNFEKFKGKFVKLVLVF